MGKRSRMCLEDGRCGHVGMLLFYIMSMLIQLSYYVCRTYMYTCAKYICMYIYIYIHIHTQCIILYRMWFL